MFIDRKDAALQLATALKKYKNTDALVLGIPRGGAETAFYIARELKLDFSIIIAKKLSLPSNPEYALGAIAEDGSIYLNPDTSGKLSKPLLDEAVAEQKTEIKRRIQVLRHGKPLPDIANRTVILADDGIATGATLFAAIAACRKLGAAKIVVAAPVSSAEKESEFQQIADEVVILSTPAYYYAVSQAYENFYNLSDEETIYFLDQWEQKNPA